MNIKTPEQLVEVRDELYHAAWLVLDIQKTLMCKSYGFRRAAEETRSSIRNGRLDAFARTLLARRELLLEAQDGQAFDGYCKYWNLIADVCFLDKAMALDRMGVLDQHPKEYWGSKIILEGMGGFSRDMVYRCCHLLFLGQINQVPGLVFRTEFERANVFGESGMIPMSLDFTSGTIAAFNDADAIVSYTENLFEAPVNYSVQDKLSRS